MAYHHNEPIHRLYRKETEMNKLLILRKKIAQAGCSEIRVIICEWFEYWVNQDTQEEFLIINFSDSERCTLSLSQFELITKETL